MARLGSSRLASFLRILPAEEKLGSRWADGCRCDRYSRSSSKIDSAATTGEALSDWRGGGGEGQVRMGRGRPGGRGAAAGRGLSSGVLAMVGVVAGKGSLGRPRFMVAHTRA